MDHDKNVLEFVDDKVKYAILSHRWMKDAEEVDYREMVKLAKMPPEERDEICRRDGYRKISCKQARNDGYEWLWVDTCCIDKRSSAELSESINSMYRWYENAQVCYAYLHDVPDDPVPQFPTMSDDKRYPDCWLCHSVVQHATNVGTRISRGRGSQLRWNIPCSLLFYH